MLLADGAVVVAVLCRGTVARVTRAVDTTHQVDTRHAIVGDVAWITSTLVDICHK